MITIIASSSYLASQILDIYDKHDPNIPDIEFIQISKDSLKINYSVGDELDYKIITGTHSNSRLALEHINQKGKRWDWLADDLKNLREQPIAIDIDHLCLKLRFTY